MEDSKIQRQAESLHIIKVLSKPQNQRMPFEGVEIAKTLQKIPFFTRFFDTKSQPFISMCVNAHLLDFQNNMDIYISQESGNHQLYVILEGCVSIESFSGSYENKLCQFQHFGEAQIAFQLEKRNEQARAITACKLMVFKSSQIKKIFKDFNQLQNCLHFLQINNYFESLGYFQKQKLALLMEKKTFSSRQILVQEQKNISKLLFVINGRLSVVKNVQMKTANKLASFRQRLLIDKIEELGCFGQYEVINNKASQVSLIAQNSGTYYTLDFTLLLQHSHPIIKKIQEKADPYPLDQELQFIFEAKKKLKVEQNKIYKKFLLERSKNL